MHYPGAFLLSLVFLIGVSASDQQQQQQQQPRRRRKEPLQELHAGQGPTPDMIWDSGLLEKTVSFATIYEKGTVLYRYTGYTSVGMDDGQ